MTITNPQFDKQTLFKRYWKPLIVSGLAASLTFMSGVWAADCGSFTTGSSYCLCGSYANARVGMWSYVNGNASGNNSLNVNVCTSAIDTACSTAADATVIGTFADGETKYFSNMNATTPPEYFKCTATHGTSATGGFTTAAHTPAGNCTFATHANTCQCLEDGVRIGDWDVGGNATGNVAANVNLCTDEYDTVCGTAATGATAIGTFTDGETKYFTNTSVSPAEHFKCTFANGAGLTTAAHTPSTPPPVDDTPVDDTPVDGSISSVGGLIFLVSGLLLFGAWASRKEHHKN
jgi:hypothetical protein